MRRLLLVLASVLACVVLPAGPAAAHSGFDPHEVAPGSVVTVTLNAADERDAAAITKVELYFPEGVDIPVVEATVSTPGWTVSVLGDRVEWSGPPADGDQRYSVTLGPLPAEPRRLQFKVLQTYDNGDVDRWIEDHPPGGPEPDMPGPVLDLVPGAPGVVPEPTTTPSSVTTATAASPTTAPVTSEPAATTTLEALPLTIDDANDEDDGGSATPLVVGALIALVVGGAAFFVWRRRA